MVTSGLRSHARRLRLLAPEARRLAATGRFVAEDGLLWTRASGMGPTDAIASNRALVTQLLEACSIRYVPVRNHAAHERSTVAIAERDRQRFVAAVADRLAGDAVYVQEIEAGRAATRARAGSPAVLAARAGGRFERARVIRIGRLHLDPVSGLRHDLRYGCDVEVWVPTRLEGRPAWSTARPTVAGATIPEDVLGLTADVPAGARIFERALLDDVTFPIDAVYTWVDGSDPVWRAKLEEHRAATGYHIEAIAPERFRSRQELRYSLRTLFMFAPWIRHVYLVTDGQVPAFLDPSHPRLTIVDHREIAPDPSVLPVFSSNAITTWLHRIPGLSEHYLYLNDDVFFGRLVTRDQFFHGNGLAKFFLSSAVMGLGPRKIEESAHAQAAKNNRAWLAERVGRTVSHHFQHGPHPQLRSVLAELEREDPETFARVSASAFRDPEDLSIASSLHHYYAYATGRAVPGRLEYLYLDLNHPGAAQRLGRLLLRREFDVFCINDTPGPPRDEAGKARMLRDFFERYFPLPSSFELPGA